jgi:hypothetical protein
MVLGAVKACGSGAVLSHWSAAELWGFVEQHDRDPHVTVPGAGTRVVQGVVVHRASALDHRDRTRHRGVPVTAAARTLLDLAGIAGAEVVRRAVRTALGQRRLHLGQLVEVVGRLGPRHGSRMLKDLIAAGPAPTRSVLESIALDLLLDAGFEHPDVNKPLLIDGRRVIPDFRWPDQRLVLELDGGAWHGNPLAREADAERQAFLETHGERVIRATWEQAVVRQAETVARVRAAGAPVACRQ